MVAMGIHWGHTDCEKTIAMPPKAATTPRPPCLCVSL